MMIRLFQENGFLSISPEDLDSRLFFIKHYLSVLKISKTFVFFLRTSSEYLTRYGQGPVFKIRFEGSVVKTDPCLYFFEYSHDVLKKKTKVLDIFNREKKDFVKINIESSAQEIYIDKIHVLK